MPALNVSADLPPAARRCAGCGGTPCYLGETRLYVCATCKKWTPWCIGSHSDEDTEVENASCDDCWCKLKGKRP